MNEPTPIERAEALIRANPRERAAYEFGRAEGYDSARMTNQSARACGDAAAAYLLLADVAPDPTTLLHLADALADHARTYRAAIAALGFADVPMERAEHEARRDRALAGMRAAFTSGGFNV